MKGQTDRATETTSNNGIGNPVIYTGMVRTLQRFPILLDTLKRNPISVNKELFAAENYLDLWLLV